MKPFLFISIALIMMSSCVTQKRCNAKFPAEKETVIETHYKETIRDTTIQGASVRDTIRITERYPIEINRWHYVRDTNGLANLKWKLDEMGNIIAECEAADRIAHIKDKEKSNSKSHTETKIKEVKFIPAWIWIFIGGLITSNIFFYLKSRNK